MKSSTAWILLVIAGFLEVGWAIGLKYSEGFTKPLATVLTLVAMAISLFLLGKAAHVLPIGTAYGIWVGIGTVGAAVLGMALFAEPVTFARVFFLSLLVVALVGLKLTSPVS